MCITAVVDNENGNIMANQAPTISGIPIKRKRQDDSEPDNEPNSEPDASDVSRVKIEPVAKPAVQVFPGFLPNDVRLVVEDHNLFVNKDLLSSASPVFEAWLKEEWQTNGSTDVTKRELTFPGKTYNDMTTFLKCLLPLFADRVTVGTLHSVLPLADEYQTERLIKECEEVIRMRVESVSEQSIYIPPSQVVTYLRWIEQYNLQTVEKSVVRLSSFLESQEIEAVPEYKYISQKLQLDISIARIKLLENLYVSCLTEAEKKMKELRLPLSDRYMTEWKRNVAALVEMFLAITTVKDKGSSVWSKDVPVELPNGEIKFSEITMEKTYKASTTALNACRYLCDKIPVLKSDVNKRRLETSTSRTSYYS